jgi:hypothetical protein
MLAEQGFEVPKLGETKDHADRDDAGTALQGI